MDNAIQVCSACASVGDEADNYCRQCGKALTGTQVPARVDTRTAVARRERAPLPAPVKRAVTAVAIGTALQIGTKLAGRYVAKQAGKSAVKALKASNPRSKKAVEPVEEPAAISPYEGAVAVSETFTIRRVWLRRD